MYLMVACLMVLIYSRFNVCCVLLDLVWCCAPNMLCFCLLWFAARCGLVVGWFGCLLVGWPIRWGLIVLVWCFVCGLAGGCLVGLLLAMFASFGARVASLCWVALSFRWLYLLFDT